jgi:hypothetical protein
VAREVGAGEDGSLGAFDVDLEEVHVSENRVFQQVRREAGKE